MREYEEMLKTIEGLPPRINLIYPFGRLVKDEIWELEQEDVLTKNASGELSKKEVYGRAVRAGLIKEIDYTLRIDKHLLSELAKDIAIRYVPIQYQAGIFDSLGFDFELSVKEQQKTQFFRKQAIVSQNSPSAKTRVLSHMDHEKQNSFIAYLNSLHNVGASGANALAESQALNSYFGELYEPFPIVDQIYDFLIGDKDQIVILTGHAGDGKSTVALDLLKRLKQIPNNDILKTALNERESVTHPHDPLRSISIVKDMSELNADLRLQWLEESFSGTGSWLIVSNTGPLLNSLSKYAKNRHVPGNISSKILELLNLSYSEGDLKPHTLDLFEKNLLILNMTRLDNVALGARVFSRMVNHSGWAQCAGCPVISACPIALNRLALSESGSIGIVRVRWVYQLLNAYEQRLTLRQMIAHLAYSLTGGMSCSEAKQLVTDSALEGVDRGTDGLERIIFSEAFFGYQAGVPSSIGGNLRAVELVRRQVFGSPVSVDFERQLANNEGSCWMVLPEALKHIAQRWAERASEAAGTRWRFAQRRMLYLFGKPSVSGTTSASVFCDAFLQSPRLQDFDSWSIQGSMSLSPIEQRRLVKSCLRVLLEVFSGFSSGQFQADHDRLFLTLRRPDRAVVQPTQLVMANLPFDDFHLEYDASKRLPLLRYRDSTIALNLTLPLLDFIERRNSGDLGSELSEIHLAQLEWFRAELLRMNKGHMSMAEITLLKANITGEVYLRRYHLDSHHQTLELD
ncbi:hypothetical protein [Thiocapsa imhoffii]|nr:hypothetical protein [Thiocapsa imhoffii]